MGLDQIKRMGLRQGVRSWEEAELRGEQGGETGTNVFEFGGNRRKCQCPLENTPYCGFECIVK